MPSYGGGAWIVDEFTDRKRKSIAGLASLMNGLETLAGQLDPGDRTPSIYCRCEDTDLGLEMADILSQENVEMIVMGARSRNSDDVLYGADTNAVIKHATRPVFIIPSHTNLKDISKVIFATDFNEKDIDAVHYLIKLGNLFHYELEIIHINTDERKQKSKSTKEALFIEHLSKIHYQGLSYREVEGKDVISSLNHLIKDTGTGMMAMLHRQLSFFMTIFIFEHSATKKAILNQQIPILIFSSKME